MEVSMQEFKSHLAQYVGQAQAGQVIELTSHRKVVARLIGVPLVTSEGIAKLLASGRNGTTALPMQRWPKQARQAGIVSGIIGVQAGVFQVCDAGSPC